MNNSSFQSRLGLGTAQFGLDYGINNTEGKMSLEEVQKILQYAAINGISTIDTARNYGDSEIRIGTSLSKSNLTRNFEIITKLSFSEELTLRENIDLSKVRLNCEKVDVFLFHSYRDYKLYLDKEDFDRISRSETFGVSIYTNDEIRKILNDSRIKIIQVPFNLLDNHSIRGEILLEAKEKGKIVHTRSCFLQGLFFTNRQKIPASLKHLRKSLQKIDEICIEFDLTIVQLAIGYCFSKNYIDRVIIGVDSLTHLQDNLSAINKGIPSSVFDKIDDIKVAHPRLLNPANW